MRGEAAVGYPNAVFEVGDKAYRKVRGLERVAAPTGRSLRVVRSCVRASDACGDPLYRGYKNIYGQKYWEYMGRQITEILEKLIKT